MKIYQELSRTSQANPHNQPGLDSALTEPTDSHKDCKATKKMLQLEVALLLFTCLKLHSSLETIGPYRWPLEITCWRDGS